MQNTTIVETHGLTKRYGSGVLAVDSVDMSVRRGEVYGFLGPNGAGKTTTLRMLVGLIKPTSGTAEVAGAAPGTQASLTRIGAIIETPAFYPYLSGYDNLRLIAMLCGVPMKRVDGALDEVELTPRKLHRFSTYSLGMKQRLGIAAALIKEPDILILDEPTNGLDPQGMVDELRGAATLTVRATPAETALNVLRGGAGAENVTVLPDGSFSMKVDLAHTA